MINQIHKTGLKYLVTQLHAMLHSGNDKILDFSSSAFVPLDLAELHFPCRCSYLLFCIYAYTSSSAFLFFVFIQQLLQSKLRLKKNGGVWSYIVRVSYARDTIKDKVIRWFEISVRLHMRPEFKLNVI